MLHYARDRLLHMSRNSVSYNSVLCCAATGVENNEGGGFEVIHGNHAVKLHGRTYHYLTSSAGNGGLNFFTFDNLANCTNYATRTLNDTAKGYQRIIPSFLQDIFNELKQFNAICKECEQIGTYAEEYMDSGATQNAIAIINESTSFLDVAQVTSDTATGNRIITFHMKGESKARSLKCTDKMWEPFIYPLFFAHAERGWGDDIRKSIRYMDYLISRLLCPEKIELDGEVVMLRTPNQALDNFIRPILNQQLPSDVNNDLRDYTYHRYSNLFWVAIQNGTNYEESIALLLKCFCLEMANVTSIRGFDEFCMIMHCKLGNENLESIAEYIELYLQTRIEKKEPEEHIEASLREICKYHIGHELRHGKMALLHVNRFQLMSRLAQTYLVDSVSRAIDYRLRFYKFHQKDLFGITSEEDNETLDANGSTSQKSFLSQSMHGSRRHLRSLAKNALALVSEFGRPSLFITLTCNPYWSEIIEQLLPGQTAFDRGDVVCQVFYRKLEAVLTNIRSGKYFPVYGTRNQFHKIKFEVRVIEYQRRGLPHVHLVLKFEENSSMPRYDDKVALATWIDHHITAVYPTTADDEEPLEPNEAYEEDVEYAEMVKGHMMHKCFAESNGGCKNDKGICSKGYDKNVVSNTTSFDIKGFPLYKRPTIKSLQVVPHNRALLKQWNGHANVEFAGSTYTVIYLYKYLFKGSKKVKLRLTNADDIKDNDEIRLYVRGRYLCSMDCFWRVLGHETYPAPSPAVRVIKIVPEERTRAFLADGKIPDIIVYFNRPPILASLKYTELFNAFTWSYQRPARFSENPSDNFIISIGNNLRNIYLYKRCKSNLSITRLEVIAIAAGETFFLRLILYNFSKISYSDCLQFNSRRYPTYQEAAVASGIVKDNDELYSCFEEAAHFQDSTPNELRTLFVMTTLQGFPTLKILYEERFKHMLYDDFLHNYNPINHNAAWNDLLCDFASRFESDGKNMRDYGLPEPLQSKTELEIERTKYDKNAQLAIYNNLCNEIPNTDEQQDIFDSIVNAVRLKLTRIYYIQGQAGSGKSTLAKKDNGLLPQPGKTLCWLCLDWVSRNHIRRI